MGNRKLLVAGAAFLLAFAILIGGLVNNRVNAGNSSSYMYENFELFGTVYQTVRGYYYDVGKVKSKDLIYGAIKGLLQSLDDEHTTFLEPAEFRSLNEDTSGEFGGLGIIIGIRDKKLTVISPIHGTPAWEKHLKPGDWITHINGESTKDLPLTDAVRKLRGKVGTKVTIVILRGGQDEPFEVAITRAVIKIDTVKSAVLPDGFGYVKLTQFAANSADELRKVLDGFAKQGVKGVVFDVRNNPGGLLKAAIDVSDLFLTEGLIVYTKGRDPEQTQHFWARGDKSPLAMNVPLVVLINEGSASASEIFAGAMQDTKRGLVAGEKSFGKGSVQTIKHLGDGSAVKLTVAMYFTPAGQQIHKKGLVPDLLLAVPKYSKEEQKAIMRLVNEDLMADYLRRFPKADDKHLSRLQEELRKKGILLPDTEVEKWLHWEQAKYGEPEVYNLKYDQQLREAVELLKAGKVKVQAPKVFKAAE